MNLVGDEETSKKRSKVRVIYRPAKEIVILDYFQFSRDALDQMFARLIHSGMPIMAHWAEGLIFIYFPLVPETDELMENYLRGRIFWSSVNFALMPKYSPSIRVGGLEIPVLDVSNHPILAEVARWLKKRAKPDVKTEVGIIRGDLQNSIT
ncbi:MAG: hypothetical protein QXR84_03370 [Candidatus Bathyarchaeia archaeon]|nr:hypothetical protein [Candidatus Bathyarchaeota archaeon]